MAENNADGKVEGNPQGSNPNDTVTPPVSSTPEQPQIDPSEKARRELQSQRDQKSSELDEVKAQLDGMRPYVAQIAQKELVNTFLTENGKDYPDVSSEDLEFLGVSSADEAKMAADWLQKRFSKQNQDALVRVQDTQDLAMTEQEREKALEDLEKADYKPGVSKFLQAVRIKSTKVK
jgi:hypothetical protein